MVYNLLGRLLARGDKVSIENGRLCVLPNSGNLVPHDWLSVKLDQLLCEAITQLGLTVFRYRSYSTGSYGEHLASGLTLQFCTLVSEEDSYVIFNVDLTRVRKSKNGRAGTPLPKGQFRAGERSHFYKFWKKSGLKMPCRLSSFHDYMGNLKGMLFTGNYKKDERLDAASLRPLSISYEQFLAAFNLTNMPCKPQTVTKQPPDNVHTKLPYKESLETQSSQGMRQLSTTCDYNYDTSNEGDTGARDNVILFTTSILPENQTTDEWLKDYCDLRD